jgi:hypothetical protein
MEYTLTRALPQQLLPVSHININKFKTIDQKTRYLQYLGLRIRATLILPTLLRSVSYCLPLPLSFLP